MLNREVKVREKGCDPSQDAWPGKVARREFVLTHDSSSEAPEDEEDAPTILTPRGCVILCLWRLTGASSSCKLRGMLQDKELVLLHYTRCAT